MTQLDFEHDPDTDFEAVDNLSLDDARREVEALREGIEYHDHLYYVANKAEISDAVYDKLFELPYEIDGIVLKADDLELWRKLGARDRSPRWALAWKFQPRQEITRLRQIVVQVGMTGMLTPVALLEPVDVGGVTVSRATLHNEGEVHRKDVRPGDTVRIARAGDVIPEVVERIKRPGRKRAGKFTMPTQCPACGAEVVHEGAYSICPAGISCAPQLVGHLKHFAAQEAMDIDGLGGQDGSRAGRERTGLRSGRSLRVVQRRLASSGVLCREEGSQAARRHSRFEAASLRAIPLCAGHSACRPGTSSLRRETKGQTDELVSFDVAKYLRTDGNKTAEPSRTYA